MKKLYWNSQVVKENKIKYCIFFERQKKKKRTSTYLGDDFWLVRFLMEGESNASVPCRLEDWVW